MSRLADLADVKVVAIGECRCPGTPHARDEAVLHRQLGYGAKGEVQRAGWLSGRGVYFDNMAARRRLVEVSVVSWNLLGPDGRPVDPNDQSIALLDEETLDVLAEAAQDALAEEPVPNESGDPSASSSPETGSPTPESPTAATSTTT